MQMQKAKFEPTLAPEVEAAASRVIGAAIEVHRELGPGLVEEMYEQALCIELTRRDVPYERQVRVPVYYKNQPIGHRRLDLVVSKLVIVENKAVESLIELHRCQALTYLHLTHLTLALLVNYNVPLLRNGIRRVILS